MPPIFSYTSKPTNNSTLSPQTIHSQHPSSHTKEQASKYRLHSLLSIRQRLSGNSPPLKRGLYCWPNNSHLELTGFQHFIIFSVLSISMHTLSSDSFPNETMISGLIHERKTVIFAYISFAYVISNTLFEKHNGSLWLTLLRNNLIS